MYYVILDDNDFCTGDWSSTEILSIDNSKFKIVEIENLPDSNLIGYKYFNNELVFDKNIKDDYLKESEIDELQSYLLSTDWYAIRFADNGEPVPADVKQKREEARLRISELRGEN